MTKGKRPTSKTKTAKPDKARKSKNATRVRLVVKKPVPAVVDEEDYFDCEDGPVFDEGDRVRVLDEYRSGVRKYDLGVNPEVFMLFGIEAMCVWPSGTGMWLSTDEITKEGV